MLVGVVPGTDREGRFGWVPFGIRCEPIAGGDFAAGVPTVLALAGHVGKGESKVPSMSQNMTVVTLDGPKTTRK